MDLKTNGGAGFQVVLSYGDLVRQSGYRTRVLEELKAFDLHGGGQTVLIVFDRRSDRAHEIPLNGTSLCAHRRSIPIPYYVDLHRISREGQINVVHAHNLYSGALALSARRAFGYKVLLDLHGRIPEEYRRRWGRSFPAYDILTRLEKLVVQRADHIVVVSQKLKDYLVSRYAIPDDKLTVVPMCSDARTFRWSEQERERQRTELGLGDRFVCVHLGSFFEWYEPDFIVQTFLRIRQHEISAHLLVVTWDSGLARDYLKSRLPEGSFTVRSAAHADVSPLLAASDLGLLLLKSAPNIQVCSPTKFSEYLNSGLPVLITREVGDFSAFTESEGVGASIGENGDFDPSIIDNVGNFRKHYAEKCVRVGKRLTWAAYQSVWADVLKGLND